MAENKDELVQHYRRMREDLLAAIEGFSDEVIAEPSLDGWSVKDHLAHLTVWDEIRAQEVTRISAGHRTAWPPDVMASNTEAFNSLTRALRAGLPADQVKAELATSRQRLLDAITSATEQGLDPSRYGEAALRSTHEAQHAAWIKRWRSERGL